MQSDRLIQSQSNVIDLSQKPVLRTSRNHQLFDHPSYKGVLLKVRIDNPVQRRFFRRFSEYRYGKLRQWNRESNEYLAAMHRGCPEIDRLSGFLGFARTTLGPALMVEKMTGPDGKLAPTLSDELASLPAESSDHNKIKCELVELMDDLERGRIIVGDFGFDNIVRAEERNGRLTIVDGIGERVLLPFTLFSRTAFKFSLARRRSRSNLKRD